MVFTLALNAIIGQYLKSSLSKGNLTVAVDAVYGADATMELMYDTGEDFNQRQRVPRPWKKGQDTVQFPFELKEGEQLRYLRLDFGTNTVIGCKGIRHRMGCRGFSNIDSLTCQISCFHCAFPAFGVRCIYRFFQI